MTKNQEASRPGLDPATVVQAALDLLQERGADGVSIRGVAQRLGVRMNTVLWHAKTKARLLELMADAIVAPVSTDGLPDPWRERARELAHRYRRALLAHRDGAAIVAGAYSAEPHTLRLAEVLVETLLDGGLAEREAAWTCWTIIYFTLGLTQEEQASPRADFRRFTEAVTGGSYPALARAMTHLGDTAFDERFDYGLTLILRPLNGR